MYLKKHIPFNVRQRFALLRCGTVPLRIETGRYENVALNDRICQLCDCGNVEDEKLFNFLLCFKSCETQNVYLCFTELWTSVKIWCDECLHNMYR